MRTKLDIHVFITTTESIPLLMDYYPASSQCFGTVMAY